MKRFSTLLIRGREHATKNRVAGGCAYEVIPLRKRRPLTSRAVRLQDPLIHEDEPARSRSYVRAAHHALGHPDYRFICQEMWRKIQSVHPTLAESGKFMDWKKYRLGRLQSEMRTEFKKSGMENKA